MPMFQERTPRGPVPVVVEAITFDDLVAYGLENGANVVNGMPWSFSYQGVPISHENDDTYLINTVSGTQRMGRSDVLITRVTGDLCPISADTFAATYQAVAGA